MAEKGKAKENLLFRIKIFALPRYWAEQERNSEKNEIVLAYINERVNKRMTNFLCWWPYKLIRTIEYRSNGSQETNNSFRLI